MVVRVRNASSKTFLLTQAADYFYSAPKLGGKDCGSDPIEIPPGFDEVAENLVVPWATTSAQGLVIAEAGCNDVVRCVVGPSSHDGGDTDWLRLHSDTWAEVMQGRWLSLGPRHLLGAIGGLAELQLSFVEPTTRGISSDAEEIAESVSFECQVSSAPANTVFLNVYDLASAVSIPNAMLCNSMMKSFGAFHAAVEVYNEEWGFYRQPDPDVSGVFRSKHPRRHPVHVYRQSVNLGTTELKDYEVMRMMRSVAPNWPSSRYDLIHCNCIHFADKLLMLLGVQAVPAWVKGLHETGAAIFRVPWPLSWLMPNEATGSESERAPEEGAALRCEAPQDGSECSFMSFEEAQGVHPECHGEIIPSTDEAVFDKSPACKD